VYECIQRSISSSAPEVIAFEAKEALQQLGSLTGETLGTDVLDKIFEEFCIGK
jgi:tRNA U34 5-carboxymethylaminomethyl modifying GTPase MnmE/TrmE